MNEVEIAAGLPPASGYRYADEVGDSHGFDVADIRKLVIYVVGDHSALLNAWNAIVSWFAGDVPPATLLGVAVLGYQGQTVEIDADIVQSAA